jgi:hypothetical protein
MQALIGIGLTGALRSHEFLAEGSQSCTRAPTWSRADPLSKLIE